jgi:hypothetical protein
LSMEDNDRALNLSCRIALFCTLACLLAFVAFSCNCDNAMKKAPVNANKMKQSWSTMTQLTHQGHSWQSNKQINMTFWHPHLGTAAQGMGLLSFLQSHWFNCALLKSEKTWHVLFVLIISVIHWVLDSWTSWLSDTATVHRDGAPGFWLFAFVQVHDSLFCCERFYY